MYARAEDRIAAHKIVNRLGPEPRFVAFDAAYLLAAMDTDTPNEIAKCLIIDILPGI